MNKYMMLTATALLSSTALADPRSDSETINLGGCSSFLMTWSKSVYIVRESGVSGSCSGLFTEIGIAGKTKGVGNNLNVALPVVAAPRAASIDFSLPLKTGGKWAIWLSDTGSTTFIVESGTYTVKRKGDAKSGSHRPLLSEAIQKIISRDENPGN